MCVFQWIKYYLFKKLYYYRNIVIYLKNHITDIVVYIYEGVLIVLFKFKNRCWNIFA